MTTADQLRAEGLTEALLIQLTQKFGSVPGRIVDAVHKADQEQVSAWLRLVLTADNLDEVFGA